LDPKDLILKRIVEYRPRKSDRQRAKIIEATIECIAREGIEVATTQEIARRIDLTRSHIAYYFPNRNSLLLAAVQTAIAIGQDFTIEALGAAKTPEAELRAYVDGTFDWLEKYPHHRSLMALLYLNSIQTGEFRAIHDRIREIGEDRIGGILTEGAKGKRKNPKAVQALSRTIRDIMVGTMIRFYCTTNSESPAQARTQAREAVMALASGFWK
jgi:AcrR family transcriptional regulator